MTAAFFPALLVVQSSSSLHFSSMLIIGTVLVFTVLCATIFITVQRTKRLRSELDRANRGKLEFLTMMSHELRTPLNAISGYTDLLLLGLRGPLSDGQRNDLTRIQRNQRQLLKLITDVLNFAKLDLGTVSYQFSNVSVADTLDSALTSLGTQFREKEINSEIIGVGDTMRVYADDEKFYQLMVNLLLNAIKFTKQGGRVTVSCSENNGRVKIEVLDTGVGIPLNRIGDIFDPFVQVDQSLTREFSGLGLGLSISRHLARGMHGELSVKSTIGEGSTFTLTLPAPALEPSLNPLAEVALPDTYKWPDRPSLQARASPPVLAP